tara:strand:- start:1921 stop:2478 length:558 start_codon:yes stop_codon:yes gene_type:complete
MKPRFEAISYEVKNMLEKAEEINTRLDLLEKAKCDCGKTPCECKKGEKCDCGKTPCQCVKKAKCGCEGDCNCKDCPKCGSKMNKAGCMKMGCGGKMAKAAIEDPKPLPKEKITDVNPHLVTESGGQTKTAYYTTNGNTIEYEDGKPKRDKHDKKVDLSKLGGRMNPHAGTGAEREDAEGGSERRY